MKDKLLRERLRAGTPRGSAVEMAVTEIIVRKWREPETTPTPSRPTDYSKPWKAAAVLALALFASSARADVFDAAAIAGAAGDIVTTEIGLSRGYVEQNIQNRPLRIGANVAITGSMLLLARHYEREGHRGWAKVFKLIPVVVFGGAAIRNMHTMQKGTR